MEYIVSQRLVVDFCYNEALKYPHFTDIIQSECTKINTLLFFAEQISTYCSYDLQNIKFDDHDTLRIWSQSIHKYSPHMKVILDVMRDAQAQGDVVIFLETKWSLLDRQLQQTIFEKTKLKIDEFVVFLQRFMMDLELSVQ